jgi:hypothetical protein
MREDIQSIILIADKAIEEQESVVGKMIAMAEAFKRIKDIVITNGIKRCN